MGSALLVQSVFTKHATQCSSFAQNLVLVAAQSAGTRHCTQLDLAVSQRGSAPEH
jgi:hypothetical protein